MYNEIRTTVKLQGEFFLGQDMDRLFREYEARYPDAEIELVFDGTDRITDVRITHLVPAEAA